MKEQYLVQFQDKWNEEKNRWANAVLMLTGGDKRYASTLEEAQSYLDRVIKERQKMATKGYTQEIGKSGLGVTFEGNEGMLVVNTRIRKRQVTEWEEV